MNKKVLVLMIVAFAIGLSACKKNNDAPTVNPQVYLTFINASADTVNVYSNGTRLNNNSNLFPLTYTKYYLVQAGQQTYQVKKPFNLTTNTVQTLFNKTLEGDNILYHSLFITDETADNAFETTDTLINVTSVSDTCYVRFVNASSYAGNLDISVGNTTLFKNVSFKTATQFTFVNITNGQSATTSNTAIKIYSSGSTVPLAIDSVSLGQNNTYTFYAKGKVNGTGTSAIAIGTMVNL